ncbi:MAG: hypothetical protein ACKVIH_01475 [Burkholderiales bacterium]
MILMSLSFLAALIVLAEALNKLERADLSHFAFDRATTVAVCKVLGWSLLALGSAGVLVQPLLGMPTPDVTSACALGGFALLIVRTRLKEKPPGMPPPESDDFSKTQVFKVPKK